jgi:hypothetical protein
MNRFIISAAAAAGLILAAGASLAPAQAAPLPSGVAQSVIDDQGAVEQARWVRCWRPDGWRGPGWRGHGWGWRHDHAWGHRHGGWRHHAHGGRGHFHHGGHGHRHGHGGHHR